MATTYDLTTDTGLVRLNIGDTDVSAAQFDDDEVTALLNAANSSIEGASAKALRAWAAALAREDELVRVGAWTGDRRDVVARMLKLASAFAEAAVTGAAATRRFHTVPLDWM